MIEKLEIQNFRKIEKYGDRINLSEPSSTKKTPFIIILHSLGKNQNQSIMLSNLLPSNAYVISVRAPIEWRVDGNESFAWFDIKGPMLDQFCKEVDILDSISYLIKIIDDVKIKFDNLDDPIMIGFSQGGIVALTMAVEKYYNIKGVFCHCGFYETKLNKGYHDIETDILLTNGKDDYVIPYGWVEYSMDILKNKCKNIEHKLLDVGHEINNNVLITLQMWLNKVLYK